MLELTAYRHSNTHDIEFRAGTCTFGFEAALARRLVIPLQCVITLTLSAAISLSEDSLGPKIKVNMNFN